MNSRPLIPQSLADQLRSEIDDALDHLPALPQSVLKVVEETNRPEPNGLKVEQHISSDQALAAKLLRVVNSSYYGLSRQISAIGQAIVILGMQQVRNLALSVGAVSTLECRSVRQQEVMKRFWMHAFASAAATQLIAKRKGIHGRSMEIMQVGALIHDIGRLFLYWRFPDIYERAMIESIDTGVPMEKVEKRIFGADHSEIGLKMAMKWNLPQILCDIISMHEGPFTEATEPMILGVHVADSLTKHIYCGDWPPTNTLLDPIADAWLNQPEEAVEALINELKDIVESVNQMYNLVAA